MKIKIDLKKIMIIAIIVICTIAISLSIYYPIYLKEHKEAVPDSEGKEIEFNCKLNTKENYDESKINKINNNQGIIYTSYEFDETIEGKYDIHVKMPFININSEIARNIDREIIEVFYEKINNIIKTHKYEEIEDSTNKTLYKITYSAYLNNNILSIVINRNIKRRQICAKTNF